MKLPLPGIERQQQACKKGAQAKPEVRQNARQAAGAAGRPQQIIVQAQDNAQGGGKPKLEALLADRILHT